jgi:hypothetical protein
MVLHYLIWIGLATEFALAIRNNFEIARNSFASVVPYLLVTLAVAARQGLGGQSLELYNFCSVVAANDLDGRRVSDADRQTFSDPEHFNIQLGKISFVGPCPLLPVDQPLTYCARFLVRPGLTGWALVQGRRKVTASDKAALDIWYVRNASLRLDITILLRTMLMVIFGERVSAAAIRRAWYELQQGQRVAITH